MNQRLRRPDVPDDTHLERYLEYPRPAHPAMKSLLIDAMEQGMIAHSEHTLPSKCVFTSRIWDPAQASWSEHLRQRERR